MLIPISMIPAPKKRTESLRAQIYLGIRDRIQMGLISPDERLVDTEVAAAYGVSRMPVREALLQLTNEGYLSGTTRGFILPRLSPQDVADIFEIRRLLEPRAAANATRDMTEVSHAVLLGALENARSAVADNNSKKLALANALFRQTWIGALRNTRLSETLSRFADQVQIVRTQTLDEPDAQRVVLRGLERLTAAFVERDVMAAYDHMTAFISASEEYFFLALKQTKDNSWDDDSESTRG